MPSNADIMGWRTLTRTINETKSPNSFLKQILRPKTETVPTRHINLSYRERGRKIAPFVARDGAAIQTEGGSEYEIPVMPTHIRTKRAMSPSELMDKRRVGTTIFNDAGGISQAMREYVAREMQYQKDDVDNSEEYLLAGALRGQISYTSLDHASFTVTSPRDATLDFALVGADRWDNPATADAKALFFRVMELINDAVSLNVTDVILGRDAADAFIKLTEFDKSLELRRLITGNLDFTKQMEQSGALYIGDPYHGIRVWRYGRTVEMPDGSSYDLIRPNYAEFICATPATELTMYYGAIEDMKALGDGMKLKSKTFVKTYEIDDPSARVMLLETNPLPIFRRPDTHVSVQVLP